MISKIFTIGAYGFTEDDFFNKLLTNKIDTFIDIRMRRGVRGSKYIFVNSNYLQSKLLELDIKYIYCKELAPNQYIRDLQKIADKINNVSKSERTSLGEAYIQSYKEVILAQFSFNNFLVTLSPKSHNIVLFCVEREPKACHRSLAAEYLAEKINVEVKHL